MLPFESVTKTRPFIHLPPPILLESHSVAKSCGISFIYYRFFKLSLVVVGDQNVKALFLLVEFISPVLLKAAMKLALRLTSIVNCLALSAEALPPLLVKAQR